VTLERPASPPGPGATLPAILSAAWQGLEEAVKDRHAEWRWPVLANLDPHDPAHALPDARVVVLRRADPARRTLEVHSDARAAKVAQLRTAPQACLVFLDRRRELQLRVHGAIRVLTGCADARRAWSALSASSRRAYLAPRRPGDALDAPDPNLPDAFRDRLPDAPAAEPGFANFAVLVLRARRLEWLRLDRHGHERARAEWDDDAADGAAPRLGWIRP